LAHRLRNWRGGPNGFWRPWTKPAIRRPIGAFKREELYDRDLNPGQVYDSVTVVNPFTGVTP
jgi:hypothetical protein